MADVKLEKLRQLKILLKGFNRNEFTRNVLFTKAENFRIKIEKIRKECLINIFYESWSFFGYHIISTELKISSVSVKMLYKVK